MSAQLRRDPIHDGEERRFFARRLQRRRLTMAPMPISHDELLADLDPGRLAWRAAGCPSGRPSPHGDPDHLRDAA